MIRLQNDIVTDKPHQRLQWRLVRSHMIVSAIATTIVGIGIAVWIMYHYFWSVKIMDHFEGDSRDIVQALAVYFGDEDSQVDRTGLQRWLNVALRSLETSRFNDSPSLQLRFFSFSTGGGQLFVFGRDGEIIAAAPDAEFRPDFSLNPVSDKMLRRESPVNEQVTEEELVQFNKAWSGYEVSSRIGTRVIGAAPIVVHGKVRAICCYRSYPVFTRRAEMAALWGFVIPLASAIAIFSTIVSGLVGHLTARRLTQQFGNIAKAAAAWAKGSFEVTAPEAIDDELGLLGCHLNRMAADLQNFIVLRRTLATVEERNRIARDLHDTVKQHIFAAGLQVGAAQTHLETGDIEGVSRSLAELEELTAQMRVELVAIVHELRPALSGDAGPFVEVIRQTVTSWSRQTGIEAIFTSGQITGLLPDAISEFHRILQEALANISRHSGASSVRVTLWQEVETLFLEVKDDGRGFDKTRRLNSASTGLGLFTMRERAALLPGGELEIDSREGNGTRILARCDAFDTLNDEPR